MHLSSRLGCNFGTLGRRTPCPVVAPRPTAPPGIVAPGPLTREKVKTYAKRSGSKRSKSEQPSDEDNADAERAWDAALANIPTEDEQAEPDQPAEADPSASESHIDAAASAERTSEQGSDTSDPAASTSYSPDPPPPAAEKKKKKKRPPSTIISLTEYQMLMDAKDTREKSIALQKELEARAAAGTLTVPTPAPLDVGRQGFQAFTLEGGDLELLVAETVDGRLVLKDSYVAVKAGGGRAEYSRPEMKAELPSEPLLFEIIPWVERGFADTFRRKAATNNVKKVYFIPLHAVEGDPEDPNPEWDLEAVFMFDAGSKVFSRSEVRLVGTVPLLEPVLRIRPSGLTLEDSFLVPDPIEVSEGAADNLADLSEEELAARLEELEQQADGLDELDEMPDVPSVDMM